MPLLTADQLGNDAFAHGQRPFGYRVQVTFEPPPTLTPEFWTTAVTWQNIVAMLDSVEMTYGFNPASATMRIVDTETTEVRRVVIPTGNFITPVNGMPVRIWHTDPTVSGFPNQGRYVFQGVIVSVNQDSGAQGRSYNVRAMSNVIRLKEACVTFSANILNDPINPTPRFDASGQVYSRLKTVKELIEDVLQFKDAFGSTGYFNSDHIDWNGFDIDPRCGGFIPSNIQFNNTPKGRAIEQILEAAGNFTFVYVILPNGQERLKIIELNLKCNRCGNEWDVDFVDPAIAGGEVNTIYTHTRAVQSDSTEWSSNDSANTIRVTMGPIRFYTGHSIIPERYEDADEVASLGNPLFRNCITVDLDTNQEQMDRAIGPDEAFYRFTMPRGTTEDLRKVKQYYVGAPLFPSWNPHEDWHPELLEITGVKFPTGVTTIGSKTEADFVGKFEWQMYCLGDSIARGEFRRANMNNLHVYEAWHAPDPCPACQGSGMVARVYSGDANEPEFEFRVTGPSGSTVISPTDPIPPGARLTTRVKNYIFDPYKFGTGSAPSGLVPLPSGNDYANPWKHLCPYCRGVGRNPSYRIRNIQSVLFQGRANAVATPISSGISGGEIYLDPDRVQTGPETWDQSINRINISQPPVVQVEVPLTTEKLVLPRYEYRNLSWKKLRALPSADQQYKMYHPLQFENLRRMSAGTLDPSDPASKIVPDGWGCYVPFTTITNIAPQNDVDARMGQVFFQEPLFIPCRKEFATYQRATKDKYVVDAEGKLVTRGPGRGQITADSTGTPTGYWRPARAWLQCFYTRDNLYEYLFKDRQGNDIDSVEFDAKDAEGTTSTYVSRASIHDGRLSIEIIKKHPTPTEAGGTEFPTGNRPIQICINDDAMDLEVYPDDLYKLPVPPTVDTNYRDLEALKKTYDNEFVRGRVFVYRRTTPGEVELEMEGYENIGFKNSLVRPTIFSSSMKDHRPRALQRGVRALEASNDLTVSGQVTLKNYTIDFTGGLGWIQHPNGRAIVKKALIRYSDGCSTILDLGRERARFGETIQKDEERMNNIETMLSVFMRSQRTVQSVESRRSNLYSQPGGEFGDSNAMMER